MANWDDYRYFMSLNRTGSVRASAEHLGVNASTVTRRLDALEKRVGRKLFVRGQTGLDLTSDGEELGAVLAPLAAGLAALDESLVAHSDQIAGTVRITMPDAFGAVLLPDLAKFAEAHPGLLLAFLASDRVFDLERGEADLAVRVTSQPSESLIGRPLGQYRLAAYASAAYVAAHDPVREPESCRWIDSNLEAGAELRHRHFSGMPSGPQLSGTRLLQAALAADLGVGPLPCVVGDADPLLRRITSPVEGGPIWLLFHPDLRGVARIQSVSAQVLELFDRLKERLLG